VAYTRAELLVNIDEWLAPEKVSMLYAKDFVNYSGITADTKEKYTEVIAERLLGNLDAFERIERITRKSSYKTASHEWKPIDSASPRSEEQIARNMMGRTYNYIGKIIDYQTPLKSVQDDNAGKIDLLSWDKEKKRVYILEFKAQDSRETLLRCILEIYTYSRIVDFKKLIADFELPTATLPRKAALVYRLSPPHIHFRDPNMKRLMKALDVDLFLLNKDNKVLEEHYYFEELEG
jgi:hypothetical protein